MCRRPGRACHRGGRGYQKKGALSREEVSEIPTFVMFRRLLLVAWIGSHAETEPRQFMGVPYTEDTVGLAEKYLEIWLAFGLFAISISFSTVFQLRAVETMPSVRSITGGSFELLKPCGT